MGPNTSESTPRETYLSPTEVSDYFSRKINIQTLANWRTSSSQNTIGGPPFLKAGGKVLYPLSYLKAWEQDRMRSQLPQMA